MKSNIKFIFLVFVLVNSSAEDSNTKIEPWLCRNEYQCECLDGEPYDVDCSQSSIKEFPLTSEDSYKFHWAVILDDNFIKEIPVIPKQTNLTVLSMSHNPISTIVDGAFTNLLELHTLNLSNCHLTYGTLSLDAFKGSDNISTNNHSPLESLQTLDLSHNLIESLSGHAFSHLIKIKTLIMTDNPIRDFDLNSIYAFSELECVEILDLSRNQLIRIPNHFFSGMRKLKEVYLSGNQFTTVPQDLNFVNSIQIMNLDHNPIRTISKDEGIEFPESMREISLSHMPELTSIGRGAFLGLKNLTVLSMHNNPKLSQIHIQAFDKSGQYHPLRKLFLQNNNLTTLSEHLLSWSQLNEIDLQHNPWCCDCHIQWFFNGSLMNTSFSNPKYTQFMTCASPEYLEGENIKTLMLDGDTLKCTGSNTYSVTNPAFYTPIIVLTIIIGVFLLLSAILMVSYAVYHRYKSDSLFNQTVTYRRAKNSDMESIASNLYA